MITLLLIIAAFGALWALAWLFEPRKPRNCWFFRDL